jgi:hypothetical protein
MNNIHNITCPGCHSPNYIENRFNGEIWFYWRCSFCQTKIQTLAESGEMTHYSLLATYKDNNYEGNFYLKPGYFQLVLLAEWNDNVGRSYPWQPIFKLPFLPNFDASNFPQKLPTLLTFY